MDARFSAARITLPLQRTCKKFQAVVTFLTVSLGTFESRIYGEDADSSSYASCVRVRQRAVVAF